MLLSITTWKALADPLQCLPCFFKLILGALGRSVNFEIPNRLLCRRPVFPDYLSVSCDYVWNIIQVKDEGKNVMFLLKKRHIKGEKHNAPMDFAEYLRRSDVSENSKVYDDRFLRNGLHDRYCYISKSRWNTLESALECSYVFYAHPLY